jgi:leucyl-tRNA synthetase
MKEYDFREIEQKWQQRWKDEGIYRVSEDPSRPKYYVLDMFPYPSGAGLHVGHPLGYIASDIYSRFKRLKGFNVLHPMGYDAFGLPAEQYAIQTGQHPAITTERNINRYREQLDQIGFSFDWSREVRTSDPDYYRWTQWIFIRLFHSFYNHKSNKAAPIQDLVSEFSANGYAGDHEDALTGNIETGLDAFTAADWESFSEKKREEILMHFRLAYLAESYVNWCPALGTVLANDEVKDGVSERGGYPVERKLMMQWSMRITLYAERLLNDLDTIDWSEALKETQRNWIGKSTGSSLRFAIGGSRETIEVFTTRPDTIYGATFLTLAPEHELISRIATPDRQEAVKEYAVMASNRSERERMADVKKITGEFTGAYAVHPFSGKQLPIWIGDYVLAGYGTGAVMGVPAHDSRDHAFAKHFGLDIVQVVKPADGNAVDVQEESFDAKEGTLFNSGVLDGLGVKDAIKRAIAEIEAKGIGKGKTNYRLRDAIFGRQRYWGEPIPVYYEDGIARTLSEEELPLLLPEVDKYLPTETGEPPLARAEGWKYKGKYEYELSTMPGWAGSSWYFLRYMDPRNPGRFASHEAMQYWKSVDLYIGGSEHATGHLLYVRFWTKFLFDLGLIPENEPAKKLINQGMIQGRSNYVVRFETGKLESGKAVVVDTNVFLSYDLSERMLRDKLTWAGFREIVKAQKGEQFVNEHPYLFGDYLGLAPLKGGSRFDEHTPVPRTPVYVDVNMVKNDRIDPEELRRWRDDFRDAIFITEEDGSFVCGVIESEKMSKSKHNVVTPDLIVQQYGADTLRLYEMFLGPLEQSKPWNTQGIEGVHRFLKKLWKLFWVDGSLAVTDDAAGKKALKSIHKLIKKVGEDVEAFSFNTSVSSFMICVNELTEIKCSNRQVLSDLLVCLSPYAPHIAEELWHAIGHTESVVMTRFPEFNPEHLVEDSFSYPVSINGKHRTNIEMGMEMTQADVEKSVLGDETVQKWLEGKQPKKIVFVKGRIVNLVV